MQSSYPPLSNFPGTNWQILGKLKLPVGANTDETIRSWLIEILSPLNLHPDFRNKVLKSAQDAAARIIQAEAVTKVEHIHIVIYIPTELTSKGQIWGFFHIEKIENENADEIPPGHGIEFYLYVEGK